MNFPCNCTGWPFVAALAVSVLALPRVAGALSLDEALRLAELNAPSLSAQAAKLTAATNAAVPAGELPDPKLKLGLQNYPIGGPDRWSVNDDFMTMQMVGVMQEVPNRDKRNARVEVAQAAVERAAAEGRVEHLKVRLATASAWIRRYSIERKEALFQSFYEENRLLAQTVRAQIAGGRALPAEAVVPKQEAALLEEQQDELESLRIQSRAALTRWVGPAANQEPTGRLPSWPINTSVTAYTHTLEHHPALAAYAPMTREAQAKVHEAKAQKQSDWSWEVAYQHRDRQFGDMVSVQFSLDLPLFPESRQNPTIAARYAELNQLQAEREDQLREHTQQLQDSLADYQRLSRTVQRGQQTLVPLATEKVGLSMASYRAGSGELAPVIAARRELVAARLKQVDAEEQLAQANARLHFNYGDLSQ